MPSTARRFPRATGRMVLERFEFDRTLAAFDGAEPVGVTIDATASS